MTEATEVQTIKEDLESMIEEVAYEAAKGILLLNGKPERINALFEPKHLQSRSSVQKLVGSSKTAKTFLEMNTKKVEIEGKFKLEAIEPDTDSMKIKEIIS